MEQRRVRLGELLVESQIITRGQLQEMLELQKKDGRRLGTLLVENGFVTETQVTQILSQQLSVPWVSLYHIDFSRQLLNLVPQEIAEKYCLVPIFVRRVRGLGETLYVAMDDPSDENALRDVRQYSGLPVRAMIAPPSDIVSAIRVYYGAGTDAVSLSDAVAEAGAFKKHSEIRRPSAANMPAQGRRAESAAPGASNRAAQTPATLTLGSSAVALDGAPAAHSSAPVQAAALASSPSPNATPALGTAAAAAGEPEDGPISEPPDSGPQIEAREVSMPAPKRGRPRKMVTLTFLDGTRVNLPARKPRLPSDPAPKEVAELTARDLVAALRARAHGADATEILGDNVGFEALFAALLSLLLRKHLIADWEFVDEFKKV